MRRSAGFLLTAGLRFAKKQQPFQAQSPASVAYSVNKDGQQTVEIANVAYEVIGPGVPGRQKDERLLLRTITRTKQIVGDIGMTAVTTVEAWPLGVDPKQEPLYSLQAAGMDGRTVDGALLVILRGPRGSRGRLARGGGPDLCVGGARAATGRDHQRRSQAGANVAVARGCQRVADADGNSRARLKDFDQPKPSVGAGDGVADGSDCPR
jgi:hypothetical protein